MKHCGGGSTAGKPVPQLYTVEPDGSKVTEAILDVVSSHPGGLHKSMLDITIRAPHAERYHRTDAIAGVACTAGENDKLERYGPTVMPVSFAPYGRLGPESCKSLRTLALSATAFSTASSKIAPKRLYGIWRAELERALAYKVADIVLLAMGHSNRHHGQRSRR